MPKHFPDLPKSDWTKNGTDAELERLRNWWDAQEEQLLVEMPEVRENRGAYVRHMLAALGFDSSLDEILSQTVLDAKQAAAMDIADSLGYRKTHGVPKGGEYEWFRRSIEAGRARREAKLSEFERQLFGDQK